MNTSNSRPTTDRDVRLSLLVRNWIITVPWRGDNGGMGIGTVVNVTIATATRHGRHDTMSGTDFEVSRVTAAPAGRDSRYVSTIWEWRNWHQNGYERSPERLVTSFDSTVLSRWEIADRVTPSASAISPSVAFLGRS